MTLFERVQNGLSRGDKLSKPYYRDERALLLNDSDIRDAAVLIAITDRPEPGVLLTTRPLWLNRHAGQVAFPGGRIDADDMDAEAAALREAEEEIALPRDAVRLAGRGHEYISGSGFRITPVIGLIPPDLPVTPCPQEVDQIFEAPLSLLLNPAAFTTQSVEWQGTVRHYYEVYWGDHRIWGITAGILRNLAHQMDGALDLPHFESRGR